MSWGLRQPTTTDARASESDLAQARAALASNPQYAAWARRNAGMPNVSASLKTFGINLPGDVWINAKGDFVSPDNSFPWGPLMATVGAGAGAGAIGGALAGPGSYVADAVNGVENSIYGGAAAGGAAGGAAAAATNAGGGAGGSLLDSLTSGKSLAGIGGLLATLAMGRNNGGAGNATAEFNQQYPQLNQLLDMSAQRAQRTDPLHQAVTQLAMSRLPTNVQR